MNRYTLLLDTPDVTIGRFDHPENHPHRDPPEETAEAYAISFVERGGFEVQMGRRSWQLAPGDVFVNYPGLTYRCRHREESPTDVCLSVRYKRWDEDPAGAPPALKENAPVLPATNRLAYLRWSLASSLGDCAATDVMAREVSAAALLEEASKHPGEGSRRLYGKQQLPWYAERVHAVRDRLEKDYAEEHSLGVLARSVGMSKFHFARIFSELTGMPPHRYLLRIRLTQAARKLREGASVTEACYSDGFHNLSHFVRLFQRRFGASPSRYARQRIS